MTGEGVAADGRTWTRRGLALGGVGGSVLSGTAGAETTGTAGVRRGGQESTAEWVQGAKLLADDGESPDGFGRSVSVSESTVVVGAYDDATPDGDSAGSVYVFEAGPDWQ